MNLFHTHKYGKWYGRVHDDGYGEHYHAERVRVCEKCGKKEIETTNSLYEFDRWVAEAKSEASSDSHEKSATD